MAGVVEGFRWALLGTPQAPGLMLGVSVAVALGLTLTGLYFFRRMERTFADLL
jgi:lipopolysaccharide transport system permease protein